MTDVLPFQRRAHKNSDLEDHYGDLLCMNCEDEEAAFLLLGDMLSSGRARIHRVVCDKCGAEYPVRLGVMS